MNDLVKSFRNVFRYNIPVTAYDSFDIIFSGQETLHSGTPQDYI